MITWCVGENSFEIREAVKQIEAGFSGVTERVDGASLTLSQLPDLLMGMSLFSSDRLVIIDDISQNSVLWEKLPDWLPRISDDIHVVFIDAKPDKRKTSYKELKKVADMHEYPAWTDRDANKAEQWVSARAAKLGVVLDRKLTGHLVRRVGVDQWQLSHAIQTLSLLDAITQDSIDAIVPPNPQENIFELFETALNGRATLVKERLATLQLQEDPYALFALLSSQALTLAAVTFSDSNSNPSKDFAIHPYVASKLSVHGKSLGKQRVAHILQNFAQTDADMKRSKGEPWLLIESLLYKVAQ